jgi:hypothetical protein
MKFVLATLHATYILPITITITQINSKYNNMQDGVT